MHQVMDRLLPWPKAYMYIVASNRDYLGKARKSVWNFIQFILGSGGNLSEMPASYSSQGSKQPFPTSVAFKAALLSSIK